MKLNIKAAMMSAAVLWAVLFLLTGIMNLATAGYGGAFLNIMASLYPGYDASGTVSDLIVGVLYALADGAVIGIAFAFLYNLFLKDKRTGNEEWQKRQPGFDTPPVKTG